MLIDMNGNVDCNVKGVVTTRNNYELLDNQFLQWTNTGKRLELWEGKREHLNYEYDHDPECKIRRVRFWNSGSICGYIN